jgi:hypothetical protein
LVQPNNFDDRRSRDEKVESGASASIDTPDYSRMGLAEARRAATSNIWMSILATFLVMMSCVALVLLQRVIAYGWERGLLDIFK